MLLESMARKIRWPVSLSDWASSGNKDQSLADGVENLWAMDYW